MSVLIVTVQNVKDKLAFENQHIWKMKKLLEDQGILSEFVTPFNDFSHMSTIRRRIWRILLRLSRVKGFSLFYLLLLLLQGREVYHQVRISWRDFCGIFAYDSITAYAAAIASDHRIPIYLMSRNSGKPCRDYISVDALNRGTFAYFVLQKILPRLLHHCRLHMSHLGVIAPNEVIPAFNLPQAG